MNDTNHNCMFLNGHGDLNISWDKRDQQLMEKVILEKIEAGYVFFVVKKKFFGLCKGKEKLTKKNMTENINNREIVIKDKDLEDFMKQSKGASVVSTSESNYEVEKSLSKEDVKKRSTWGKEKTLVAIKPAVAG